MDGTTAIVVGGASGIGWATCRKLHSLGARVVVADVNTDAARQRADELGDRAAARHVDVRDEDSVERLFDEVTDDFGGVGTVVDCELSLEGWRTTLDVCLTGAFLVVKHAGRHMVDGGSITLIASLNGRQPGTGMSAYCSAKAGVLMLTEVAALELAPGRIRVNAISPGLVDTPLVAGVSLVPGLTEDYLENTPLGRSGRPEEIAEVVAFLASDAAAWMTGANIDVNGGAHTRRYPDLLAHLAALAP